MYQLSSFRIFSEEKKDKERYCFSFLWEGGTARRKELRTELRKQLNDPSIDVETKFEILAKLEKMPRDSSSVRLNRRCRETGRSKGVIRRFQLCRHVVRRRGMLGEIPGLVKASW